MEEIRMNDLRVKLPAPCPESWDAMAPAGCNRHCASCDKIIHDLEQMTIGDVEALIAGSDDVCVRARIDGAGKVALKSDSWRGARRMIATVGAGVGLLASGSVAMAGTKSQNGAIAGKVEDILLFGHVTATDANGNSYKAKIKSSGNYKIKRLPPGKYAVQMDGGCGGDPWSAGEAVVEAAKVTTVNSHDPNGCIIVGQLILDQPGSISG
jgi:hypothetical protein